MVAKHSYWNQSINQRNFFEGLAKQFQITTPSDWGRVSTADVKKNGGASVLRHYFGNSLFKALKTVFPEKEWNSSWFLSKTTQPRGYWSTHDNQRTFLNSLARELNLNHPSDWGKLQTNDIFSRGGKSIFYYYKTLYEALKTLYPHIEWKEEWFSRTNSPRGHWKSRQNQRIFLDELGSKLNIKQPCDWGKIKISHIAKNGGASLLKKYGTSVYAIVKGVYSDVQWRPEWFKIMKIPYKRESPEASKENRSEATSNTCRSKEFQRNFLDSLKHSFQIKEARDWGNITLDQFRESGAGPIISRYGSSPYRALTSIYPEISWEEEWFHNRPQYPVGYWNNTNNHKKFLDEFAKNYGIKSPRMWGKISARQIREEGAYSMLHHYNHSVFRALQENYPSVQWKREWFPNLPKYTSTFWEDKKNQKSFLDSIASEYHLSSPNDWQRISLGLIRKKGGQGLLRRYKGSLLEMMKTIYVGWDWKNLNPSQWHLQSHSSEGQNFLFKYSNDLFPDAKVEMSYRHPALASFKSNVGIELDIWIPTFNLALEFHGWQHYRESFNESFHDQRTRDSLRRKRCEEAGITLIEIPHWWDMKIASLAARILQVRPDLGSKMCIS